MSQRFYQEESIILLKQETTEKVDAAPSAAANAYKVFNLEFNPLETTEEEMKYMRGYPGASDSVVTAAWGSVSFEIPYIGAATPGTAPPCADALRCAGYAQTLIAAAVTGTCQGGNTSKMTLAVGASAVNGYYDGLLVTCTGGAGNGQSFIGYGYDGTTKDLFCDRAQAVAFDNTSQYSIAPSAYFTPIRGADTPSATLYLNNGGINFIFLGGRGDVSLDSNSGAIQRLKFKFLGALGTPADQTPPTGVYTAWQDPLPLLDEYVRMTLAGLAVDGTATGLQSKGLTFAKNSELNYRVLLGGSGAVNTGHNGNGNVSIEMPPLAVHNFLNDVKLGNKYPFFLRNGTTAGKQTVFFMPAMKFKKMTPSVDQGIQMAGLDYSAQPVLGLDDHRFVFA